MSTPELEPELREHEEETDTADTARRAARRSISEWAVVLALIALIASVAWAQFGSLFEASTEGSEVPVPAENVNHAPE